ncbi:MAG TPA: YbjN domain-containing protein [Thermohalobaculum sp.]|nr:YbjN domain-containing protein [Thermohalobaculum sp.]
MAAVEHFLPETDVHPIDIAETLAEQAAWEFDRVGEDQIAVAVEAVWRTYSLSLIWSRHDDMLRLISTIEFNPPEARVAEFHHLLNIVNDKVWAGSFTLWREEKILAYRSGLTLAGGAHATPEQVEAMVLTAIGLSERFYPAFQLVGWGEESAEEAAAIAIGQAYGTA